MASVWTIIIVVVFCIALIVAGAVSGHGFGNIMILGGSLGIIGLIIGFVLRAGGKI